MLEKNGNASACRVLVFDLNTGGMVVLGKVEAGGVCMASAVAAIAGKVGKLVI